MILKKRASNIPIVMSALIVFFAMLPTGLYLFVDDYFKMSDELDAIESRYLNETKIELKSRSEGLTAFIDSRKKQTMESAKAILKRRVARAKSILLSIQEDKSLKNSPSQMTEISRNLIRNLRIETETAGYYFAVDKKTGMAIVYPPDPSKEKTSLPLLRDIHGVSLVPQIVELGKQQKNGYLTYIAPKLDDNTAQTYVKISYIDTVEPMGWVIGTGVYLDEIEDQIKEDILEIFSDMEFSTNRHVIIMDGSGNIISNTHAIGSKKGTLIKTDHKNISKHISNNEISSEGSYSEYNIINASDNSMTRYLGFVKPFEPWGWYIISGVEIENMKQYVSERKKEIKSDLIKEMLWLCGILVFIVLFSISLGQYFKHKMLKGFRSFFAFFKKAGTNYEHIDTSSLEFYELKLLGEHANVMVNNRLKQEKIINAYTKSLLEANKKLRSMANLDSMTGIANRRFFDNTISKEWLRSLRTSKTLTVAILDVDFFKQFNDIYGHPAGDECLRKIATAMSVSARRPYDLVARYGGEEFVILFPETDRDGAIFVAKKVNENINAFNIPHSMNPAGKVTFSMGIATTIPSSIERPESLLKKADEMLYKAKRNGRNRICIDDGNEITL